MSIVA